MANILVNISDSRHALRAEDRAQLVREAQRLLDKNSSIHEAHFSMHVKTQDQKNLVEVNANLITDNGAYHTSTHGWNVDQACAEALSNIKAQIKH